MSTSEPTGARLAAGPDEGDDPTGAGPGQGDDHIVATRAQGPDEGPVKPAKVPRGGWRDRIRTKPGLGQAYRVAVFIVGAVFIGIGFALAVLPGPLTIPPVLLGLWIWSTEFRFAQKLFDSFKSKAKDAWAHAKVHPISSTLITVGGLALAGLVAWAVPHFGVIDRVRDFIGI